MATQETAINYSKEFLSACKALPIKIDKAILFGSTVRNAATEYSDIDLALFSNQFSENVFNNIDMIFPVYKNYTNLDLKFYNSDEYEKGGLLLDEIKQTGIEVKID